MTIREPARAWKILLVETTVGSPSPHLLPHLCPEEEAEDEYQGYADAAAPFWGTTAKPPSRQQKVGPDSRRGEANAQVARRVAPGLKPQKN